MTVSVCTVQTQASDRFENYVLNTTQKLILKLEADFYYFYFAYKSCPKKLLLNDIT